MEMWKNAEQVDNSNREARFRSSRVEEAATMFAQKAQKKLGQMSKSLLLKKINDSRKS